MKKKRDNEELGVVFGIRQGVKKRKKVKGPRRYLEKEKLLFFRNDD